MKTVINEGGLAPTLELLPVIPTIDIVVFPHMIIPLLVLDRKIINGVERALEGSKQVLLLAARSTVNSQSAIGINDLYSVGTIASIVRVIKIPDGGIKVLIQGLSKGQADKVIIESDTMLAQTRPLEYDDVPHEELTPHIRNIKTIAEKVATSGNTFNPDFHIILSKMNNPDKIADFVLSHLSISVNESQQLLETSNKKELFEKLYHYLSREVEVAEIQEKIKNNARESMSQSQKEYYLREQLKAIKHELGEDDALEIDDMREKLLNLEIPQEIKDEVLRQINRLERASPDSLEATVTRNYLEWILAMPWGIETTDNLDIEHAKEILNSDHYGLKEVKERIIDLISVRHLKQENPSTILCFVGPPGTGKTSLGKSIARSLGRKYARISLGGVRDEAEIRGHRRTYVGAIPGRFIQALRKAESCNPVIVIDEIDKIGADFRGDPSAAMLEVLDPQQNKTFYDNYLGIPFDLSKVMFIATANSLDTISHPLLDRMEVIELAGYTVEEKLHISKNHLLKKALDETGLSNNPPTIEDSLLQDVISSYTREAGVRQLERVIGRLYTKAAREFVETKKIPSIVPDNLEAYLGPRKFIDSDSNHQDQVGISNGLAKTAYGGEIIKIEAVLLPGRGKLILTGQLGNVMQESARAALSYAQAHAQEFGIKNNLFETNDLHIHVPAGAIPKDGPSAGITMLTAILSTLTQRPISAQYAMTGELNLRGPKYASRLSGTIEGIFLVSTNSRAALV